MVTVSVEATWRLSRVEFNLPYSSSMAVTGYGEVLLQETEGAPAAILKQRDTITPRIVETKTYGAMPSTMILRALTPELLAETVELDGTPVSFGFVMDALTAFFDKWRIEDADKPPTPTPLTPGVPNA